MKHTHTHILRNWTMWSWFFFNFLLQCRMGTTDEVAKPSKKGTIFVEDLPEEEQVVVAVVSFNS